MLRVNGVSLQEYDATTGRRFVISGANVELYRDMGCSYVTDGQLAIKAAWAAKIKALGVNAIRLNYTYTNLTGDRVAKFLDFAQEFAKIGVYVMISDHQMTGKSVSLRAKSYPMFKQLIEGFRARGIEDWLIVNPFNEPGPDDSLANWTLAQKDIITNIRSTCGFKGVIVLDGGGWSTQLNVSNFKTVMAFDATLTPDAKPNVILSNHLYPNISGLDAKIWAAANQIPLLMGELGQENPGASSLDPQYVKNVIAGALKTGIPAGHNGLFAWIIGWCDTNKMIEDWTDPAVAYTKDSPLNAYGKLWVDNYFSKVVTTPIPDPDPVPDPTPTPTPTGSYKVTGTIGGQQVDLTVTPILK